MVVAAGSVRGGLARVARDAAASVAGVVALSSGPGGRWATEDRVGRVPGVVCLPLAGGGFRVELHLVARMTPLAQLADKVRDRLERDAARAGLADQVQRIDVAFEDIAEPLQVPGGPV